MSSSQNEFERNLIYYIRTFVQVMERLLSNFEIQFCFNYTDVTFLTLSFAKFSLARHYKSAFWTPVDRGGRKYACICMEPFLLITYSYQRYVVRRLNSKSLNKYRISVPMVPPPAEFENATLKVILLVIVGIFKAGYLFKSVPRISHAQSA